MNIEVVGAGCHSCLRLEHLVGLVLAELGIEAVVTRVEDPRLIARYVPGGPPGLMINGHQVPKRTVPTKEELWRWITGAAGNERHAGAE